MGYLVFLCGLPAVAPGEFYLAKHRTAEGLPMRHSLIANDNQKTAARV
jgi:hypothetical protein